MLLYRTHSGNLQRSRVRIKTMFAAPKPLAVFILANTFNYFHNNKLENNLTYAEKKLRHHRLPSHCTIGIIFLSPVMFNGISSHETDR